MTETYLRQLQRTVEQAVRPVRASLSCKRGMREEMLSHLLAVYEQELGRLGDEQSALLQAGKRFGDPVNLTPELQDAVPPTDRFLLLCDMLSYSPGESSWRWAARHTVFMLAGWLLWAIAILPLLWLRGRLHELDLILHILAALCAIMVPFSMTMHVLPERIGRALFGAPSERSLRAAVVYALLALLVFPALAWIFQLLLGQDLGESLTQLRLACYFAPAAPLLFMLLGRQVADESRRNREWLQVEID